MVPPRNEIPMSPGNPQPRDGRVQGMVIDVSRGQMGKHQGTKDLLRLFKAEINV